ncbi:MAG: YXWGXW repeat-containing protein [Candidatus Sulfotelmatobacter sp.]
MRFHRAVRFIALALVLPAIPAALSSPSSAQIGIGIGISVHIGPPALPVYEQPLCPGAGYLWTPGYWAWDDDAGYYWVPGTWVVAPVGMLWTPGYWGWNDGLYVWNAGYWGPHIGFYGGINYGFGYGGVGFVGGEWRGGAFFYNTAVMHVDTVHITNVYVNRTVIVNNDSHVAFNGGEGGIAARPTAEEEAYSREPHQPAVAAQVQQEHAASQNKALFASNNHGAPAVAATARPGEFSGHGVVAAKAAGAPYRAPAMSPREARATPAESRGSETRGSEMRNDNNSRPSTPPARTENARPQNESHPANAPKAKPANQPKPPKNNKKPPEEEKHDKGR